MTATEPAPAFVPPPPPPPPAPASPVVAARPAWREPALLGASAAAGTLVLAAVDPSGTHVPLCPLKAVTGLDCPLCGSLRAVHSLTRGRLVEALDHNVLFTLAVPVLVAAWAWWLVGAVRTGSERPTLPNRVLVPILVVLAAFGVARNIPSFGWLGSTA